MLIGVSFVDILYSKGMTPPDMATRLIPAQFTKGNNYKPTTDACLDVLDSAESALGATRYQMARLLGISSLDYCRWRRGAARVGSKYLTKIAKLLCLQLTGVPLHRASFINWKEGTVHWRNGQVSEGLNLLEPVWGTAYEANAEPHSSNQVPPSYGGPKGRKKYVRAARD